MIPALTLALALAAPGAAPSAAPAPPPGAARSMPPGGTADPVEEERARAYFTDTRLLDQSGRERRFYSDVLAGRVVVINFMFTRCEYACPLMTARLAALGRELGERYGTEVEFVSISVDPRDTPADLAAFAKKHRVPERGWTFLTGPRERVQEVVKRLGQWVEAPEDHGTLLLVGNTKTRHWAKLRSDHATTALAAQVRRIADRNAPP
jgi:protein SCO1/2